MKTQITTGAIAQKAITAAPAVRLAAYAVEGYIMKLFAENSVAMTLRPTVMRPIELLAAKNSSRVDCRRSAIPSPIETAR